MNKKWQYKVLTHPLTADEEEDLAKWCYKNIGNVDESWAGYFLGSTPGNRLALIQTNTTEHCTLLQLTWS
jgi:hypothetical protein